MQLNIKLLMIVAVLFSGCTINNTSEGYKDNTGPYINIQQYEFYTEKGNALNFSNISGYDDYDGLLPTKLNGYVDFNTVGDYYPKITCTDLSGNMTSQVISVHVVPVGTLLSNTEEQSEIFESEGCQVLNCTDPLQQCDIVLNSVAERYEKLFYGESGEETCLQSAPEGYACEVVLRNDQSFWGYGMIEKND